LRVSAFEIDEWARFLSAFRYFRNRRWSFGFNSSFKFGGRDIGDTDRSDLLTLGQTSIACCLSLSRTVGIVTFSVITAGVESLQQLPHLRIALQ
jgi:hypothetical protein